MTERTFCAICDGPVPSGAPIPLCVTCLQQAYLYVRDIIADHHGQVVELYGRKYDLDPRHNPEPPPLVYYVQFGDRIKIGTTTNLWQRITAIPCDQLLAVEPGDADVERERHAQFARYRLTRSGEWFRDCQPIRHHIGHLRRTYGDPAGRRYADGRLVSHADLIVPVVTRLGLCVV
jgi:hypothetical protein